MGMSQRLSRHHPDGIIGFLHLTPDFKQFGTDGLQMLGNDIFYRHITLRHCCRKHKGSCLNLIGNDAVLRTMQFMHAPDSDHIRTGTFDICTHTVQKVGKIHHMRLFRRVLDHRLAFRHNRRHHHIHSGTYRNHIHINMVAAKTLRLGDNQAVFYPDAGSQRPKSFDMLVYGPKSDIAASRKCNLRFLILA